MSPKIAKLTKDLRKLADEADVNFSRMPTAGGALYVPPSPGFNRRMCANCCLWIGPENECDVHEPGVETVADAVCGYWVGGTPLDERSDRLVLHVLPKFSGLMRVPGGTHCGNCKWFHGTAEGKGMCHKVANEGRDGFQEVHADGCCALWEQ